MARQGISKDNLALLAGDVLVPLLKKKENALVQMDDVIKAMKEADAHMDPPVPREYDPHSIKTALYRHLAGTLDISKKGIRLEPGWTAEGFAESVKILHLQEEHVGGERVGFARREQK